MHIREHCDNLKNDPNTKECIKCWDYVIRDSAGNMQELKCKFCGTTITGWRQIAQPEIVNIPDDNRTKLVIQKMGMVRFGNYREMLIKFSDGSKHATPLCDTCITKTFTNNQLHMCHIADMEDLHNAASTEDMKLAHEKFADRIPIGHDEYLINLGIGKKELESR